MKRGTTAAIALISFAAALAVINMCGCASAIDAAKSSRNMLGGKVSEAAKAWEVYDAKRITDINASNQYREDAQKAILAYANGEHAEAVLVFNTAWGSLVAFDKAIQAAQAGDMGQLALASQHGFSALAEIVRVLTKLGVKIPVAVQP